ncbi:MAG: 23S rRNA (adenine(2503)-C(2))-methyltransferase RlmN [Gammaproteobacteria bacterium]|nr:23S rRNA (adenine(2503)-C(2))-methyltransferase RlmN [Gammaproteobacteria bacterium]MCP5135485.1 23S rRNA (adenine(2503)-C(2))-methyltransferase RlmN [Gammaproteobacteria bacterium]
MNSVIAPADALPDPLSRATAAEAIAEATGADGRVNLLDLDRTGLETLFSGVGERPFRTVQLMKWLYHQRISDFDQMTNLSHKFRDWLKAHTEIRLPEVVTRQDSVDGTIKWLLRIDGGNSIETVYIPDGKRGTLCVSSQVGCSLECRFCSTAKQGFNRNLTAGEIAGQMWIAQDALAHLKEGTHRVVTNVVFMGMGEPLLNYRNVVTAAEVFMDDLAWGLGKRRVTVSTSGVVPALHRLRELTDVSLAVSLHAPDNALRDELVPVNRRYPLETLIPACKDFVRNAPRRHITWEYVMLKGINDQPEHARKVLKLLEGIPSKMNLIPFNPFPGSGYETSSNNAVHRFQDILAAGGLRTTIRKTRGEDIDAACGQLKGQVENRVKRLDPTVRIHRDLHTDGAG